jgi:hypothetical protein
MTDFVSVSESFDYGADAELFPARGRATSRQCPGYKRFDRAAEAIRYAIEDLPPALLAGAYLEVDEARFDSKGIRRLYDAAEYPLARRAVAQMR